MAFHQSFNRVSKIPPRRGALVHAAYNHQWARVKELLMRGADVNDRDENENTALIWATWSGRADMVRLLLKRGAAIDASDTGGHTALMCAAIKDHAKLAAFLIHAGANTAMTNVDDMTADILAQHYTNTKTFSAMKRAIQTRQQQVKKTEEILLEKITSPALQHDLPVPKPFHF